MGQVMVAPSRESKANRVGPAVYRKHALPLTEFTYKDGRRIKVTPDFLRRMKENFDRKVRDIVPVPAKGPGGHSDDWRDSVGNTIGFEVDPDKGAFVTIQVVDPEADKAIQEDRLKGVSLSFDPDYLDPVSGERLGPVLRHTALTNIPYVKGTEGFERVSLSEPDDELILLAEVADPPKPKEADTMDLDQIKAALKKDHGIDLDDITGKASKFDETQSRAKAADGVRQALKGAGVELSEDGDGTDLVSAVQTLVSERTDLSEQVKATNTRLETLEKERKREKAESLVKPYAIKGLVAESQRESMVSLAETNYDLAKGVLEGLSGGVLLSEVGSEHSDPPPSTQNGDVELSEDEQAEVERLAKLAAASAGRS